MNEKSFKVKLLTFLMNIVESIFMKFGFVLVRNTPELPRKRIFDVSYRAWDYNRYSSLELCAYEILSKKVKGDVAELGVYQGVFASKLNELFPNKKLYLFDTFEGFDERDVLVEKKSNLNSRVEVDFSTTNIEYVLSKMKYKENCIIKKGYFPSTAEDVDTSFAFVSIDADLYKPIYDGLCYFYPRLEKGGYIFIHDFNNKSFPRAKEAVLKYCNENNLNYFPLSDVGGTVALLK